MPLARPIARYVRALESATVDTGCGPAGCGTFTDRKRIGESVFLSIVSRSHIFKMGCRMLSSSYNLIKSAPKDGTDIVKPHPKGNQNPIPLYHVCDSPGNMDGPCSDRFERFVEDVYPAVYVRNEHAH